MCINTILCALAVKVGKNKIYSPLIEYAMMDVTNRKIVGKNKTL